MDEYTKNVLDIVFNSIQLIIILGSAFWAYFRFRREDPFKPRTEFDLECHFWGPQKSAYFASFVIMANNKGNIEHTFSEIRLRIRGIKNNEPLIPFVKYPSMVNFPEKIMKGINIVPPKLSPLFVRPGVNQAFHYVTRIPGEIRFIIVKATFKYQSGSKSLHSAERVFEVKNKRME